MASQICDPLSAKCGGDFLMGQLQPNFEARVGRWPPRPLCSVVVALVAAVLLGAPSGWAYRQRLHASGKPFRFSANDVGIYFAAGEHEADAAQLRRMRKMAAVAADRWSRPTCSALRLTLKDARPPGPAILLRWADGTADRAELRPPQVTHSFSDTEAEILSATVNLDARLLAQPSSIAERHLTLGIGEAIGLLHSADANALMHDVHRATARAELQPDDVAGLCATYGRVLTDKPPPGDAVTTPADPLRDRRREDIHRKTLSLRDAAVQSRAVVVVVALAAMIGWIARLELRRRRRKEDL